MTLIAQLAVNGAPFLIGDVLLSSETRTGLKVSLPLVGDINQILADNGLPFEVAFAQKINVFEGRIAVAWSGPLIQAKRALDVLANISSREKLTVDDILGELNAIDQTKIDQLQLIGLLVDKVNDTTVTSSLFLVHAGQESIPNFGTGCLAGSGRDAFLQLLQKGNWLAQRNASEYHVAHGILGALTNQEYRTGNTIANRWGGGFEALTVSPVSGRLEKVGDILHTFWEVTENAEDSLRLFPFFYKTTYWRDALVLRAAACEPLDNGELRLKANDIMLIPPLLKGVDEYDLAELGPIDFSYRAVCCHVLINKTSNRDFLCLVDQRASGQDVIFQIDRSGGQLHITNYLPDIIRMELSGHK